VLDVLIEGATVIDGTGAPAYAATVGTTGDRVSLLDRSEDLVQATRTIDGRGLTLAPGFVDVHNHSDLGPLVDPEMASTIRQGVTTVVVGNCGSSPWPVAGAAECAQLVGGDPELMDLRFSSLGDLLNRSASARPAVNVAALVGHGAIRAEAMGTDRRPPNDDERRAMRRSVAAAMEDGAIGLSTGLIYPPGMYAATDEVVELAREAAGGGGIYASHIRGEGEHLFRAVDEAIEVGRRAGIPAHVSHLKCEGSLVWGRAAELLARFHGPDDVTADQYPYTAWASSLSSLLPEWAPVVELPAILRSAEARERLVGAVEDGEGDAFQSSVRGVGWDRIVIEASGDGRHNGRSVAMIAELRSVDPVEACFRLLLDDPDTSCIGHAMDEQDVRTIMADPDVMVASDASSMTPGGPMGALPVHPRNYGTFPRAAGRYVRDGVLGLEDAVRKMTSIPAARFGLRGRGTIEVGAAADLVLFDASAIEDTATFEEPHRFPIGIGAVLVNGNVAWSLERSGIAERAGRVLRHGRG
jgi:N-acyl-D-amino-acid deacylase